ncbi:MAG: ABC transporter substrate-binding protein [Thermodesulfobacteriota bacterium]
MKLKGLFFMAALGVLCLLVAGALAADPKEIVVGGVFDITGPTSDVGKDYAQGAVDAAAYINKNGGVDGIQIKLIPNDYAYEIPKAVNLYKKYKDVDKVFVIQGWGTGDTNALTPMITKDQIVYMSASYDGNLTDPKKNPFNFFIGSSYSDHIRMAVRYAKDEGAKKFCFIYPDHPYGKNPIPAGKEMAKKVGLDVGPDISVALNATDATSQLLQMKEFDPEWAWIGGTTSSTAVIIKDAAKLNLKTKFLINTWGIDENLIKLAGAATEGRTFGFIAVRPFGYDVPMTAKMKTLTADKSYSLHYNKAWTSMMVMWEALKRAKKAGKLDGPGLKAGLETLKDFDTGGITPPLTYTPEDHRATTSCGFYTIKGGKLNLVKDLSIERLKEYLGN